MQTQAVMASIITIGDELLIGQTIDTNSAWMAQELNKAGIWVRRRVAVGDLREEIWNAIEEERQKSQILLLTGGLGPTADDITKPLLCEYFGSRLVVDEAARENVVRIFQRLNRPLLDRNLRQAEVPEASTVIQNKRGTAPGMWFEKEGMVLVSMPGVPFEMKGMMTDFVIPELVKRFELPVIYHRTLLTAGIGESFLAELIHSFEEKLPAHIKLAYLPNFGMVRLRLTGTGSHRDVLEKEIDELFLDLQTLVKTYLVTDRDEPLQVLLGRLLRDARKTVGTAESCTGGEIARLITSIPGSSAYYKGSIVSYANTVKQQLLGVREDTLRQYGAVSQETVTQMVKGAIEHLGTDFAVATSGIMGPDGGTEEKPVGTVWIAVGNSSQVIAEQFRFRFDRERNIELAAMNGLNLLRRFIQEN